VSAAAAVGRHLEGQLEKTAEPAGEGDDAALVAVDAHVPPPRPGEHRPRVPRQVRTLRQRAAARTPRQEEGVEDVDHPGGTGEQRDRRQGGRTGEAVGAGPYESLERQPRREDGVAREGDDGLHAAEVGGRTSTLPSEGGKRLSAASLSMRPHGCRDGSAVRIVAREQSWSATAGETATTSRPPQAATSALWAPIVPRPTTPTLAISRGMRVLLDDRPAHGSLPEQADAGPPAVCDIARCTPAPVAQSGGPHSPVRRPSLLSHCCVAQPVRTSKRFKSRTG
jgi:hypothetical protein